MDPCTAVRASVALARLSFGLAVPGVGCVFSFECVTPWWRAFLGNLGVFTRVFTLRFGGWDVLGPAYLQCFLMFNSENHF